MSDPDSQTVSLSFYRFAGVANRAWAFAMMGVARRAMKRTPDIGFWKLCGSGSGEGFTPIPNTAVYAILATWPDHATARARMVQGVHARYHAHAAEAWSVFLSTASVRGTWSGQTPFQGADNAPEGPVAALTRATIRPATMLRFWARVPDISAVIGTDPNVAFKIGIGEVPWLHQVTFSIWPNAAAMAHFARQGPHGAAIRAARDGKWFSDELFARFTIRSDMGSWNNVSPLANLDLAA